jgi:hypothetical protein
MSLKTMLRHRSAWPLFMIGFLLSGVCIFILIVAGVCIFILIVALVDRQVPQFAFVEREVFVEFGLVCGIEHFCTKNYSSTRSGGQVIVL